MPYFGASLTAIPCLFRCRHSSASSGDDGCKSFFLFLLPLSEPFSIMSSALHYASKGRKKRKQKSRLYAMSSTLGLNLSLFSPCNTRISPFSPKANIFGRLFHPSLFILSNLSRDEHSHPVPQSTRYQTKFTPSFFFLLDPFGVIK